MTREDDGVSSTSKLGRKAEIAKLATKSAGGGVLYRARRRLASDEGKEQLALERRRKMADELVETLGEMKGLAMKFGQQASYRSRRSEGPLHDALGTLLQDAPSMDAEAAAGVVERELGRPPDELFAEWSPEPMAAASIGQVHRARTHDGRLVAVKVQYPGAAAALAADVDTLSGLVRVLTPKKASSALDPAATFALLKERLVSETDYLHEAADHKLIADAFRGHPFIRIPGVLSEYSAAKVLTTELAEGARYDDVLAWDQEQRDLAGEALFRFHYRCIFRVGRHSADPHPGNYVFGSDGAVWCLDFGAMWTTALDFTADVERLLSALSADGAVFENDPDADEDPTTDAESSTETEPAAEPEAPDRPEAQAPTGPMGVPAPPRMAPPFRDAVFAAWLLEQGVPGEARALPFPSLQPRGPHGNVLGVRLDDEERALAKRLMKEHNNNVDTLRAMQAVVATLGAVREWGAIAREIWPFTAAAPSTPLGEAEARWASSGGGG